MKISSFDLNLFVILNSIYTEGSLTKAAEVVGITQPAVSNALSRLRVKFNDDLFLKLKSYDNVLITGHQAFLTNEALKGITDTTIENLNSWEENGFSVNEVC